MGLTFRVGAVMFTAEKSEISELEYEILVRFNCRCIGAAVRAPAENRIRHLCSGQLGNGLLATRQAPLESTDFELAALVASNWLEKKSFLECTK